MKKFINSFVFLVILYLIGALFLAYTDPQKLPLPILILPFAYAFITVFLTLKLILTRLTNSRRLSNSVGATVSIFVVLLLVLASIRQLTIRDLMISLALTIIISWYLIKTKL